MLRKRLWILLVATFLVAIVSWQKPAQPAAAEPPLNFIVIMTDDQNYNTLPVMRNMMGNMGGSWLNFTNAYAVDSIGGVARAALLTGQYTHHHGVFGNNQSWRLDERNTLATWLDDAGYYTMLIGKYLNGYPFGKGLYKPKGWDRFVYYNGRTGADQFNDRAVKELTRTLNEGQTPFFFLFAHRAPQRPAKPPKRYKRTDVSIVPSPLTLPNFGEEDVSDKPAWVRRQPQPRGKGYPYKINGYPGYMWSTTWIEREHTRMLQELIAVDDGIASLLNLLADHGELDNTVIFYFPDSGYSWGSHRRTGRACAYEECSQLPYLVFYPGSPKSGGIEPFEIDRIVNNIDVTATILDLANVTPGRPQDGRSLVPLLTANNPNNVAWPDHTLLQNERFPQYRGIRTSQWKYIDNGLDEIKELYDMVNDPYELQNLAGQSQYASVINQLAAQLDDLLED